MLTVTLMVVLLTYLLTYLLIYNMGGKQAEQDRLDIMHVSFRLLLDGKLAMAPFTETPRYVLDIGTGTGIWAIQFGECMHHFAYNCCPGV